MVKYQIEGQMQGKRVRYLVVLVVVAVVEVAVVEVVVVEVEYPVNLCLSFATRYTANKRR